MKKKKDIKELINFAIELNEILISENIKPINYGPYPFIDSKMS